MRKPLTLVALATLPLLALPGCTSNSTGTTPSGLKSSTSAALAALASPDTPIFQVSGADTLATGDSASAVASTAGGTMAGPGPCVFDPSTGEFTCPSKTGKDGLTLTRTFILRDAAGNVQSAFDKTTTESIENQTTADGTMSRPGGGTVTIHRSGDMITSGLSGDETTHTLNGTEQGTVDGTWTLPDGTSATEHTTISDSTVNLVIPVPAKAGTTTPSTTPPYPLSGSRTHATTTTGMRGTQTKSGSTTRTETFDGTAIVQVVLTVNGQTKNCTVDLANHSSTCGNK